MIEFIKKNISDIPEINESVIQKMIADNPLLLGLGELELIQREKTQDTGGRLDVLLRNPETSKRFEVEIQLGQTDPSHIIRTIEYWDIERKRNPQYEHCAVIIAEDITNRFFNVISLFNGFIPIIAIQMNAYCVNKEYGIIFTRILDQSKPRSYEEDEVKSVPADRQSWETPYPNTIKCADQMLEIINDACDNKKYELNYTKPYIGLCLNKKATNFSWIHLTKKYMWVDFKITDDGIQTEKLKEYFNDVSYTKENAYHIQIYNDDLKSEEKKQILKNLASTAESIYNE